MTSGLAFWRSQKYGSTRLSPCLVSTVGCRAGIGGRAALTGSSMGNPSCQVEADSKLVCTLRIGGHDGYDRNPRLAPATGQNRCPKAPRARQLNGDVLAHEPHGAQAQR